MIEVNKLKVEDEEIFEFWGITNDTQRSMVRVCRSANEFKQILKNLGYNLERTKIKCNHYPFNYEIYVKKQNIQPYIYHLQNDETTGWKDKITGFNFRDKDENGNIKEYIIVGEDRETCIHELGHVKLEFVNNAIDIRKKICDFCKDKDRHYFKELYRYYCPYFKNILEDYSINTYMIIKNETPIILEEPLLSFLNKMSSEHDISLMNKINCSLALLFLKKYGNSSSYQHMIEKYDIIRLGMTHLANIIDKLYGNILDETHYKSIYQKIREIIK